MYDYELIKKNVKTINASIHYLSSYK